MWVWRKEGDHVRCIREREREMHHAVKPELKRERTREREREREIDPARKAEVASQRLWLPVRVQHLAIYPMARLWPRGATILTRNCRCRSASRSTKPARIIVRLPRGGARSIRSRTIERPDDKVVSNGPIGDLSNVNPTRN